MRTTVRAMLLSVLIALLLLAAVDLLPRRPAHAQQQAEAKKSWSHVQVVTYASGLTGFFDTKTGRLYLYDANVEQPFIIREIDELGKPLKRIRN